MLRRRGFLGLNPKGLRRAPKGIRRVRLRCSFTGVPLGEPLAVLAILTTLAILSGVVIPLDDGPAGLSPDGDLDGKPKVSSMGVALD